MVVDFEMEAIGERTEDGTLIDTPEARAKRKELLMGRAVKDYDVPSIIALIRSGEITDKKALMSLVRKYRQAGIEIVYVSKDKNLSSLVNHQGGIKCRVTRDEADIIHELTHCMQHIEAGREGRNVWDLQNIPLTARALGEIQARRMEIIYIQAQKGLKRRRLQKRLAEAQGYIQEWIDELPPGFVVPDQIENPYNYQVEVSEERE